MQLIPDDSVHVNGPLIVPGGKDPDKPDTLVLWDSSEGIEISEPGDVMQWVRGTAGLVIRALNRLALLKAENGRDDLRHVISWAVPAVGDQLHCRLQVRLP